jgi:hypothetical protein
VPDMPTSSAELKLDPSDKMIGRIREARVIPVSCSPGLVQLYCTPKISMMTKHLHHRNGMVMHSSSGACMDSVLQHCTAPLREPKPRPASVGCTRRGRTRDNPIHTATTSRPAPRHAGVTSLQRVHMLAFLMILLCYTVSSHA